MTNILQIDEKEAGKKLSTFRQYSTEVLLIGTLFAVYYLFGLVRDLQNDYRDYILNDGKKIVLQLNESTDVLRDIKTILKENQIVLKESKIIPVKK